MISVDFHPIENMKAEVKYYPGDRNHNTLVNLVFGNGQNACTIFGKVADAERFEKIAMLLNETFSAERPAIGHVDPADLAGDYAWLEA